MSKSFIQFLTENQSVEVMLKRMADELEVVDKGFGDSFVVRDKKMSGLTGKEHTYDVRLHGHGDVEVHPHSDKDHDRAAEIERKLLESKVVAEDRKTRILAQIEQGVKDTKDRDAASAAKVEKRMKAKYGDDWRRKAKEKGEADHDAHNASVRGASPRKKLNWMDTSKPAK